MAEEKREVIQFWLHPSTDVIPDNDFRILKDIYLKTKNHHSKADTDDMTDPANDKFLVTGSLRLYLMHLLGEDIATINTPEQNRALAQLYRDNLIKLMKERQHYRVPSLNSAYSTTEVLVDDAFAVLETPFPRDITSLPLELADVEQPTFVSYRERLMKFGSKLPGLGGKHDDGDVDAETNNKINICLRTIKDLYQPEREKYKKTNRDGFYVRPEHKGKREAEFAKITAVSAKTDIQVELLYFAFEYLRQIAHGKDMTVAKKQLDLSLALYKDVLPAVNKLYSRTLNAVQEAITLGQSFLQPQPQPQPQTQVAKAQN